MVNLSNVRQILMQHEIKSILMKLLTLLILVLLFGEKSHYVGTTVPMILLGDANWKYNIASELMLCFAIGGLFLDLIHLHFGVYF